ncbi:DUF2868 domain-containing protein [Alteromonas ponticola]|uniref:DUF2868 domain-containing protein n=1 Tax=Alteromonas aquimaris TaxID=2998417 RepID=A0ABT3P2N9_9ALTE|nr:DUF2868 domain-containing protein [Alteromonas aquimaris]MCW8107021.1 DUF2868 domain-containing protein [Alteromonas aquimaris]
MTDSEITSAAQNDISQTVRMSPAIVCAGMLLGFLLSFVLLNGDAQGRVNLFYLLLVFLLFPLLGLITSVLSMVSGKGVNLARIVSKLGFLGVSRSSVLRQLRQRHLDKHWFFLQSQFAMLAYSLAGILTLLILLVATDINFVWRSTILTANDIYPWLKGIASPWWFWESAQPSVELLERTQDSRLTQLYESPANLALWWPFILATQIFYAFLLRGMLLVVSRSIIKHRLKSDFEQQLKQRIQQNPRRQPEHFELSEVRHQLPSTYAVINWSALPEAIVAQLDEVAGQPRLVAGPLASEKEQTQAEQYAEYKLVLVKAWEPPLGELHDFLQHGQGFIYPVNYHQHTVRNAEQKHLKEWRRFCSELHNWQLFQPAAATTLRGDDERSATRDGEGTA